MSTKKSKPGPKAETVKIDMEWEKAVGKALEKPRPKEGWPDEKKKGAKKQGG